MQKLVTRSEKLLTWPSIYLFSFIVLFFGSLMKVQAEPERITVAYCSDCVPFQFTDEGGEPAGLIIDLWRLWEQKTGVGIEFHAAS